MTVQKLLSAWRAEPSIGGNMVEWRAIPARPPKTAPLPETLQPALAVALRQRGIQALYTHQAAAWESLQAGEHVAIVTATASGKTLCYNLPVLNRLLQPADKGRQRTSEHPGRGRALYIFPTKALAQDQAAALRSLLDAVENAYSAETTSPISSTGTSSPMSADTEHPDTPRLPVAIYDGDTPTQARPAIRNQARVLITNPDMLHVGILPHHTHWAQFLRELQFIVIDEMHVYRGVFGSHVANVLRRLKRIARFYGADPQFILTSATIANPGELARSLVEAEVRLVEQDGSPRGVKHFLIYNPPIIDQELGLRSSALQESVRLADDLLTYGVQTVVFGRSRRTVELILTYLRQRAASPLHEIRGYRSGYLAQERRAIERGLRQGEVRVVVATNALELGIDIGGMGAAVLVGYPGSIAATLQQAGRAGRGEAAALALLVATSDPLDQFLASHPEYLFERSPEHALLNPDNLLILLEHLRCAAFELPFQQGERFGSVPAEQLAEMLEFLAGQGVLHRSGPKYFWMADQYPAQGISLRSASTEPVILQTTDMNHAWEDGRPITIGQVDQASAHWMVHPQAIYLHEGQTYIVEELDLEQKIARLQPTETDYYTTPRSETSVQLVEQFEAAPACGVIKARGEILVTSQVIGYRKVRWYTHEQLGIGDVDLPPTELLTTGYWLALEESTIERLREQGLWRNDPNDYGPNWARQRDLARARDSYRCQVCRAPESGRAHAVHHKTPFRAFTSYEQANQLENLVTLCQACHRRVETAVRVRSGLAGLAFALRHLAPFFLMCDVGDLGVHADPQSPICEGRPAIIVYDQAPAGIGLSQHLFELHDELMARTHELVAACNCSDGCPSCVGPGGENGLGGKSETLAILEALRA